MILGFTVCFNEYFGNKFTYLCYVILFDVVLNGVQIIQPKIFVARFGHENLILIHGLIIFFQIPTDILQSVITPLLLENFSYFITFSITNIFTIAGNFLFCFELLYIFKK